MSWLRLAWRLQRFELMVLGAATLVWLIAAAVITWQLNGYAAQYPDCFGLTTAGAPYCEDASLQFAPWDQTGEAMLWLVLAIPLVFGTILGSPIVAREIEDETAQLAWAYSRTRTRWLRGRLLPVGALLIILLAAIAGGAELLEVARLGGENPGFQRFDQRGLIVVLRGVLCFALAVATGTWLGRTLPALLAGAILSGILIFGLVIGLGAWRASAGIVVERNSSGADEILPLALVIEPVAVLDDGTVISDRSAALPEGESFDALRIIPGDEYWPWIARESASLSLLAGAATAAAFVVIRRRRPL